MQYIGLNIAHQEDFDGTIFEFKASNLIPRTNYSFQVFPIYTYRATPYVSIYSHTVINTALSQGK